MRHHIQKLKLKTYVLMITTMVTPLISTISSGTTNPSPQTKEKNGLQQLHLPKRCQKTNKENTIDNDLFCANHYFVYRGTPINPRVLQELAIWISDALDGVLEINLTDSQFSKDYAIGAPKIRSVYKNQKYPPLNYSRYYDPKEDPLPNRDIKLQEFFYYQRLGLTSSGLQVIAYESNPSDAHMYFFKVLILKFIKIKGITFNQKSGTITWGPSKLVIKKIGEVSLDPCFDGHTIKLQGNQLIYKIDPEPHPQLRCQNEKPRKIVTSLLPWIVKTGLKK